MIVYNYIHDGSRSPSKNNQLVGYVYKIYIGGIDCETLRNLFSSMYLHFIIFVTKLVGTLKF